MRDRSSGRGGSEEAIAIGWESEERQLERLRKIAEDERRRADALEERVGRQSAVVSALADAVRKLAADPDNRAEAAELFELLSDASILGDEAPGSGKDSDTLTCREREVLVLAEKGMTNREIGKALFISENTVRKHLKGANRALGTHTKAEAVHAARRLSVL
ncbi:MAG: LuxR C-terminal-related transcriptional regulator [Rubrobacteraceae bacterium]